MNSSPNGVGRPRKISTPEEFDRLVDSYLEMCRNAQPPEPVTLTGLCLALGFCSKQSFYEYGKIPEFVESVTRARMHVEHAYERKLHLGPKEVSSSSITFALKNMDWSDKMDVNHGGQAGNPVAVTGISALYAALGKKPAQSESEHASEPESDDTSENDNSAGK